MTGGGGWGWPDWATTGAPQQQAIAITIKIVRRKVPPLFRVLSTVISDGCNRQEERKRHPRAAQRKYSSFLLPNRRILTSKE